MDIKIFIRKWNLTSQNARLSLLGRMGLSHMARLADVKWENLEVTNQELITSRLERLA